MRSTIFSPTLARIRAGALVKGSVLAVADVAAVMAAKRAPETFRPWPTERKSFFMSHFSGG
jgi:molybdenum cofactor biosynthesis enzyme